MIAKIRPALMTRGEVRGHDWPHDAALRLTFEVGGQRPTLNFEHEDRPNVEISLR